METVCRSAGDTACIIPTGRASAGLIKAGQQKAALPRTVRERTWRRVPESNRSSRICNPLRNLSANPPEPRVC